MEMDALAQRAGAQLPPGTLLCGRYRLESVLGMGAFGVVWRARHVHLDNECAVKLLDPPLDLDPVERSARFLQEARVAAQLKSRHVVQVFDFGVHEEMPFLVMELLPGESLASRLHALREEGRCLSAADTARILGQVAEALEVAHTARVVHRDLKPDNIFLVEQGESFFAKVLDFGIAKWNSEEAPSRTATRVVMGTAHYMSPEQFESARQVDHRADLWSLAVIAFECLTGRLPFPGETFIDVAFKVCREGPLVASQIARVPEGFDRWFARSTAQQRDFRFGSALQQARALAELCAAPMLPRASPAALALGTLAPAPQLAVPQLAPARQLAPVVAMPAPVPTRPASSPSRLLASLAQGLCWSSATSGRWACLIGGLGVTIAAVALWLARGDAVALPLLQDGDFTESFAPGQKGAGLRVHGQRDGLLFVDGREIGRLPQELRELPPGEHALRVSAGARYRDFERQVSLRSGRVLEAGPLQLEVIKGLVTIRTGINAEGAEITLRVGDSRRSLPPLPVRLEVETDRPHVLLARKRGFQRYEQALVFEPGQAERTIEIQLSERSATPAENGAQTMTPDTRQPAMSSAKLTITSTPPSKVLLDGKPMGTTPLREISIEPGSHRVIFIHGPERRSKTVDITAGTSRVVEQAF